MPSPSRSRRAAVAVICLALLVAAALGGAATARAAAAHAVPVLRVCADPNNLPFTDRARRGFEDRILEVVAAELGARLEYTWWAQRRGFLRNTLKARRCDLVAGMPSGGEGMLATAPYYRSSYVFVTRREARVKPRSLDDPALRDLRIGVQLVGDDYASSPPGFALARRGIVDNVRGYLVYGDYREESPPAEIVRAVARGDVDVALVWGPLAGYWARRQPVPLEVAPIEAAAQDAALPMAFDVAMGVRKRDARLRDRVDAALARRRGDVDRILAEYGVPRVAARPREEMEAGR
ncbi:MAG TPA: quinoprotein dehydrogenase-associated putative ABC transporter substrate-binding protein [Thermoanaerobaculia bacterium]|jgi:mxaJ protein|nr:quinoprotein dehydrogenase-associated putative ABC transporter substrate-binding protein [Thermoanaerobaculia bacterium]